jgi:dUTP pyrophosphatase
MKFKKFRNDAKLPMKSHLPDVGLDLFMPEAFDIEPFETKTIGLGLGVAIPEGFAGMLVPRSSIAAKGLIIQTSIIDPDYTGEFHVIVTNCSQKTQHIERDQRLCSLVMFNALNARVEIVDEFDCSERGTSGLGSSGV